MRLLFGWEVQKREGSTYLRKPAPSRPLVKSGRGFDAAQPSNLTFGWDRTPVPINTQILKDLPSLRARTRNEGLNNPYASRFLKRAKGGVVGPSGIRMQSRVINRDGTADVKARKAIERFFTNWGTEENCTMGGQLDFIGIQGNYLNAVAEDGESLWLAVFGKQAGPFGFALHQIDAEQLDIELNESGRNGARIVMGIEVNKWGRPQAYHLKKGATEGIYQHAVIGQKHQRVPASLLYHGFLNARPGQHRGIPWMAPSLLRVRMLNAYLEAAVVNARIGASKVGVITGSGDGETGAEISDQATGEDLMTAEPGSFIRLKDGEGIDTWSPDYPNQQLDPFVRTMLRDVSVGLDIDYPTLSGDLENVNFSSIRAGMNETWDAWKTLQGWESRGFLTWVFRNCLRVGLAKELILVNGKPLSIQYEDKYQPVFWQGRRWPYVNPLQEAQAKKIMVEQRFITRGSVTSDLGNDPDETIAGIAEEDAKFASAGISLPQPDGVQDEIIDTEDDDEKKSEKKPRRNS